MDKETIMSFIPAPIQICLAFVVLVLKLLGIIHIGWIWVCFPLWIGIVIGLAVALLLVLLELTYWIFKN